MNQNKYKYSSFYVLTILLVGILFACSTEKNTFLSRNYHGMTAHYNGYFNANDLLNQSMKTYRDNLKENYYEVLPISPLPNEEEVKNMYTPIDTAISKCAKVISRHAMPSMENPSNKREEHNEWIDENWITIGKANYIRRDYDVAIKNFDYARKFFADDKSSHIAQMWMARTYLEQGKLNDALFCITALETAKQDAEESKKSKKPKGKKKSKNKDDKEPAPYPKKLNYDLYLTKAMYFERKKMPDEEIEALTQALEYCKKSKEKARINFILGQLYERKGDRGNALIHYNKCLKGNATYEMAFHARMKRALNDGGTKTKSELAKMAKDPKNAEFRDQIHYTLGLIAENEGYMAEAKSQFTQSALYSLSNARQKGMAYEHLGDLSFKEKNYVSAQKYYDSCGKVIPETYPNYKGVKNKAENLEKLVVAIETAQYEDSVLRIAALSEGDQTAFLENVVKTIKEKEKEQKKRDAERLALLQEQQAKANQQNNNASGSKFYWNNAKAKQEGFEEFKKLWGQRTNEDNWRRSDKIVFSDVASVIDTNENKTQPDVVSVDSLTAESLMAKLPKGDSAIQASRERMMSSYFDAGKIYLDQLNEQKLANDQFDKVLSQPFESKYKVMSAFEQYRMAEMGSATAKEKSDFILLYYPTSDYAGFIRDPEYFVKKKEREKINQDEYMSYLDRFERGLYGVVIAKATDVIQNEKQNAFRSKYMLLRTMSQAKLTEDKKSLVPYLDTLIAEYPETPEGKRALEMRRIILTGYSKNEAIDFSKKSPFTYSETEPMYALIFLDEKVNLTIAKTRVIDFNKEFFGKYKLVTNSKAYGKELKNVVTVKELPNPEIARKYVTSYKADKKYLADMKKFKIIVISETNMKVLFEKFNLVDYELFYDENY